MATTESPPVTMPGPSSMASGAIQKEKRPSSSKVRSASLTEPTMRVE